LAQSNSALNTNQFNVSDTTMNTKNHSNVVSVDEFNRMLIQQKTALNTNKLNVTDNVRNANNHSNVVSVEKFNQMLTQKNTAFNANQLNAVSNANQLNTISNANQLAVRGNAFNTVNQSEITGNTRFSSMQYQQHNVLNQIQNNEKFEQNKTNNQKLTASSKQHVSKTNYFSQSSNNNSNSAVTSDNSKRVYIDNITMKSDNISDDFEQLMELAG